MSGIGQERDGVEGSRAFKKCKQGGCPVAQGPSDHDAIVSELRKQYEQGDFSYMRPPPRNTTLSAEFGSALTQAVVTSVKLELEDTLRREVAESVRKLGLQLGVEMEEFLNTELPRIECRLEAKYSFLLHSFKTDILQELEQLRKREW